ncbi:unnamed protein product [Ectocarpus sp. 4 AP-2014]
MPAIHTERHRTPRPSPHVRLTSTLVLFSAPPRALQNESRKNATDMLSDPVTKPSAAGTPSRHFKPTPPPTPPSACSPYRSVSEGGSSETFSPHSLRKARCGRNRHHSPVSTRRKTKLFFFAKGITAPTTAVDDVVEKFGRPRARSLSRRDLSLPALEEEAPEIVRLEDRRRTMSMSITEGHRYGGGGRSRSARQVSAVNKRCLDCNLPPSFAMEGEPAIFCRSHQMEGMVNVLREGCTTLGCCRTASYGFPGEVMPCTINTDIPWYLETLHRCSAVFKE